MSDTSSESGRAVSQEAYDFIKNEWIPALRSGEFAQTAHRLATHGRYCCLGVACELRARAGKLPKSQGSNNTRYGMNGNTDTLPVEMRTFFGDEEDGDFKINLLPLQYKLMPDFRIMGGKFLSSLNDWNHSTFDEIADLLEYNLQNGGIYVDESGE